MSKFKVGDRVKFSERFDLGDERFETKELIGIVLEVHDAQKLYPKPPAYSAVAVQAGKTPLKTRFPAGTVVYQVKVAGETIRRNLHESQVTSA